MAETYRDYLFGGLIDEFCPPVEEPRQEDERQQQIAERIAQGKPVTDRYVSKQAAREAVADSRCAKVLERSGRRCPQKIVKGTKFCQQHNPDVSSDMVLCQCGTLIPAAKLDRHVRSKCNVTKERKALAREPFFSHDRNAGLDAAADHPGHARRDEAIERVLQATKGQKGQVLEALPRHVLRSLVYRVRRALALCNPTVDEVALPAEADNELVAGSGWKRVKHERQCAAMVQALGELGALDTPAVHVEFGAGKGLLSSALHAALPPSVAEESRHVMVDIRHLSSTAAFDGFVPARIKMDIKDLHLWAVPEIVREEKAVVAISKHLCGCATDFTLRCLLDGETVEGDAAARPPSVGGVCIATCCHHRISYDTFLSPDFLSALGLDRGEVSLVARFAGWAGANTQGRGDEYAQSRPPPPPVFDAAAERQLAYPRAEDRFDLGYGVKRVIDWGRVLELRRLGWTARLRRYADLSTTTDNVVLLAQERKDGGEGAPWQPFAPVLQPFLEEHDCAKVHGHVVRGDAMEHEWTFDATTLLAHWVCPKETTAGELGDVLPEYLGDAWHNETRTVRLSLQLHAVHHDAPSTVHLTAGDAVQRGGLFQSIGVLAVDANEDAAGHFEQLFDATAAVPVVLGDARSDWFVTTCSETASGLFVTYHVLVRHTGDFAAEGDVCADVARLAPSAAAHAALFLEQTRGGDSAHRYGNRYYV